MLVTEIQRFCTHDGPGVRTTVFFKGCPLNCVWCHNPETKSRLPQLFYTAQHCIMCGGCSLVCPNKCHTVTEQGHTFDPALCDGCGLCAEVCPTCACEKTAEDMSVEQICGAILRDREFYGERGGVTLSGGEPLIHSECVEILKWCKSKGIGTAVETCGYVDRDLLIAGAEHTDLFLWDIKGGNPETHRQNTGVHPQKILDNLKAIDEAGNKTVIRCVAVAGLNMSREDILCIGEVYGQLKNCLGVEILPYHAYGGSKSVQLGLPDSGRTEWIPDREMLLRIGNELSMLGVKIIQ